MQFGSAIARECGDFVEHMRIVEWRVLFCLYDCWQVAGLMAGPDGGEIPDAPWLRAGPFPKRALLVVQMHGPVATNG